MYTPPFTITSEILHLVSEISEQVGAINMRLGKGMPSPMLRKENQIKTIHSSLAIEHNSLSLAQVTDIIEGKHVLGAPNEIQEVKNALQAYQLMLQLDAFNEKDLLKAHGLMMKDLVNNAGRYRSDGVGVFNGDQCIHMAPPAQRVPILMGELFEWVSTTDTHPLVSSCVFHYELEFIHPFADGNGRMGRYWQTLLLARWKNLFAWLPVETIVKEHQQEYYDAIAKCDAKGDSTDFIAFMLQCLHDAVAQSIKDGVAETVSENVDEEFESQFGNEFGVKFGVKFGVNEKKVLLILRAMPNLTASEIALRVGISQRGVEKQLKKFKELGIITRQGSDKNGFWVIVE